MHSHKSLVCLIYVLFVFIVADHVLSSILGDPHSAEEMNRLSKECRSYLELYLFYNKSLGNNQFVSQYVRVMRCSGWSPDGSQLCVPTKISNVTVKVPKQNRPITIPVIVQVHDDCEFQCKQTKNDCLDSQTHKDCKCSCTNVTAKVDCRNKSNPRGEQAYTWIEDNCTCVCSKIEECSTNQYFNLTTCECLWNFSARSSDDFVEPAACEATPAVVSLLPLLPDHDPMLVQYSPIQTRLMRCSGSCDSDLRMCRPTHVEPQILDVSMTLNGTFKLSVIKVTVAVEQHRKCECGCRQNASSCKDGEKFDDNNCLCKQL